MYTGAHVHEGGRSHFESFQRYLNLVRTADISIEDAAPDLKMNRKFMEEVVKANPAQVAFVHPRLRGDRAFMRMAVQDRPRSGGEPSGTLAGSCDATVSLSSTP